MRRLFASLALLGLVGAACAPAAPTPPAATGGNSAPAATAAPVDFKLRVGLSVLQATMDPHAAIGNVKRYGLYDGIVNQDKDAKPIPGLASEWKNTSPTTWQFKLAQGRKFHDGNPVTAEDIKYSFDRVLNPANKLAVLARVNTVDKVEIVDPQTINVITKEPDPILLLRVAALGIVEKAYVERVGPADFALNGMGTGPFMQKSFKQNDQMVLVPNPNSPDKTKVTELTIRQVPELAARTAGVRSGELDIINNVPVDQAELLKSGGATIVNFDQGTTLGGFIFTNLPDQPTQNKLVRQAMQYAVDKAAIAKNIYKGYTNPTGQIIQKSSFGYNASIQPYAYDPAKAKALLAQAGYPNGFKISIFVYGTIPESQALFLAVQSNYRDVGIEAELQVSSDAAALQDRYYGRVPRPTILSVSLNNSPALDADFAINWFSSKFPDNERRYNNPAFDEPYLASLTEMDPAKRGALLQKAVAVMYEDPPFLYLVDGFNLWAVAPGIGNVVPRGDVEPLWDIITKK